TVPCRQARLGRLQRRRHRVELAVRHRPAPAPAHRRPHPRPAVPHRPRAPAHTPILDTCVVTGRARLSCRRAEEIFEESTRLLANPLASPDDFDDMEGWTLHRLRHSALTHDAEDGTSTPMLLARSRHASVRSLERYARPGPEAVARHVAEHDPARRRR